MCEWRDGALELYSGNRKLGRNCASQWERSHIDLIPLAQLEGASDAPRRRLRSEMQMKTLPRTREYVDGWIYLNMEENMETCTICPSKWPRNKTEITRLFIEIRSWLEFDVDAASWCRLSLAASAFSERYLGLPKPDPRAYTVRLVSRIPAVIIGRSIFIWSHSFPISPQTANLAHRASQFMDKKFLIVHPTADGTARMFNTLMEPFVNLTPSSEIFDISPPFSLCFPRKGPFPTYSKVHRPAYQWEGQLHLTGTWVCFSLIEASARSARGPTSGSFVVPVGKRISPHNAFIPHNEIMRPAMH